MHDKLFYSMIYALEKQNKARAAYHKYRDLDSLKSHATDLVVHRLSYDHFEN